MAGVSKPLVCVQVRELAEFVLRTGDLGVERDFVGPNRALEGIRGQHRLQRSRPAGYQKEVRVSHDLAWDSFTLRVQGRIDGLLVDDNEVLIEEIKTVQGRWNREADPLHWAQAKFYGFMFAHAHGYARVTLRLVYLNLDTGEVVEFPIEISFEELAEFFRQATSIYLEWLHEQWGWRQLRDASIRSLAFPFAEYRSGQRAIAVAVYRALVGGKTLFVEAPTGIGKTVAVLFPALKAMAEGRFERVFYLTARTTARAIAEKALADLRKAGLRARTLALTAKEKICVQQGQPCDPQLCPLARGYYDRRKPAMRAALAREELSRLVIEEAAQAHQVCPFELSLDMSMWVDAVVCDYNYVFDPRVFLRRHFADAKSDCVLLIDEAHNLVDRAREMFSAEISLAEIREVSSEIQSAVPSCARALRKLSSSIRKLGRADNSHVAADDAGEPAAQRSLFPPEPQLNTEPTGPAGAVAASRLTAGSRGELVYRQVPGEIQPALEAALHQCEAWLMRNEPAEFRPALLGLYFQLLFFSRTLDGYDEHYRTLLSQGKDGTLSLFCLDPSFLLGDVLGRVQAAVFFSATLSPLEYHRQLLGGAPGSPVLQLPSPFPPENLAVILEERIRTNYQSRQATLGAVADAIGAFVKSRRGNYLVYLPSYEYLEKLRAAFESLGLDVAVLAQRPAMTDAEREGFLAAFQAENCVTQVGFAVMGGVFGEGIDLVGERLIGAVIVGVGLPQICLERDLIREYFDEKLGEGFDYAYAFPGINRVLQASGRVIRSETDRGAVLLVDARFAQARYQQLLPRWWRMEHVRSPEQISALLQSFWAARSG